MPDQYIITIEASGTVGLADDNTTEEK